MNTQYGMGDEATWPASNGHPNDPRTGPELDIAALPEDHRMAVGMCLSYGDTIDNYEDYLEDAAKVLKIHKFYVLGEDK